VKGKGRGGFSEKPIAKGVGQAKLSSRSKTRLLRAEAKHRDEKTFFATAPLAPGASSVKNWE
jgi:hypothetical protein